MDTTDALKSKLIEPHNFKVIRGFAVLWVYEHFWPYLATRGAGDGWQWHTGVSGWPRSHLAMRTTAGVFLPPTAFLLSPSNSADTRSLSDVGVPPIVWYNVHAIFAAEGMTTKDVTRHPVTPVMRLRGVSGVGGWPKCKLLLKEGCISKVSYNWKVIYILYISYIWHMQYTFQM